MDVNLRRSNRLGRSRSLNGLTPIGGLGTTPVGPAPDLSLGGAASHLAQVTREGIAEQYGEFLTFLLRTGRLDEGHTATASQVTPSNVAAYLTTIKARVGSVTVYMYIKRLHSGCSAS